MSAMSELDSACQKGCDAVGPSAKWSNPDGIGGHQPHNPRAVASGS